MRYSTFALLIGLVFVAATAVDVTIESGPVNFWFLDCKGSACVEIEGTRQENASAAFSEIAVPEKPDVKLFVQCLKSEGACSVAYRTAAWEKTVAIPFGESSTFPASNTREVLAAEIRPAFYRTPGDVEMTLRFFAVDPSEEKQTEAVDLSAEDVQVINGSIKGDIRKVDATTYEFVVAPSTSGASFAVILRRDLSSTRGLPLRRGVLQGCIFDDEAPYLVNTQFLYDLLDESNAKTLRVSLNEPVTVSRIGGVTQSATEKPGYLNTFEVVATGTGDVEVVFVDRAGNEFLFRQHVTFDASSPLQLINVPARNATLPRNGRVELVLNHAVSPREKQVVVARGEEEWLLPMENERFVRIDGNRVMVFLESIGLEEGAYWLQIPQGALVTEGGVENDVIAMEVWVAKSVCNTNYVVSGMRGEKCKCFSVENRCQCTCGETQFSRQYSLYM